MRTPIASRRRAAGTPTCRPRAAQRRADQRASATTPKTESGRVSVETGYETQPFKPWIPTSWAWAPAAKVSPPAISATARFRPPSRTSSPESRRRHRRVRSRAYTATRLRTRYPIRNPASTSRGSVPVATEVSISTRPVTRRSIRVTTSTRAVPTRTLAQGLGRRVEGVVDVVPGDRGLEDGTHQHEPQEDGCDGGATESHAPHGADRTTASDAGSLGLSWPGVVPPLGFEPRLNRF